MRLWPLRPPAATQTRQVDELATELKSYAAQVVELAESVRIKALRVQREEEMRRGR